MLFMHVGKVYMPMTMIPAHIACMHYNSVHCPSCRFGLNGRALILRAAQRAAKKRKFCHPASQDSDSKKLPTAEPHNRQSTATHEQATMQPAASAGTVASGGSFQQDTDAKAAPDAVQLPGQLTVHSKTNTVFSAPRSGEVLSIAITDSLIDGLDAHDQPLVAYINRSSVPRILRQVRGAPLLHSCGVHAASAVLLWSAAGDAASTWRVYRAWPRGLLASSWQGCCKMLGCLWLLQLHAARKLLL